MQLPVEAENWMPLALKAAKQAGAAIMSIYENIAADLVIDKKADDSPLTEADRASHLKIVEIISATGLPVLSEEGKDIPYEERKDWEFFWMVDPLDGTKEFIKRNGEFTVNIALIHRNVPVAGVIYVPVTDKLFWNEPGRAAMLLGPNDDEPRELSASKATTDTPGIRVVASRSHLDENTQAFIDALNQPKTVSMGSSLKFMLIAEQQADLYPRFAPTMEWDTAAAQAILQAAGGSVIDKETGEPMAYNKQNLLNNYFTAFAYKEN